MLNFDNIEDLVAHMFANLDNEDCLVSVVANKEMVIEIMNELLDYEGVILNSCNIDDDCDHNKEYRISLYDDVDSDYWYVNVEKDYDSQNNHYLGADGYVLFHEDINSKSLIDKQNNELMTMTGHDLFVIDKDIEEDNSDENDTKENTTEADLNNENANPRYSVTVKVNLDTDEAVKLIHDMEKDMRREMFGMFDHLYRLYLYDYSCMPIRIFY